MKKFLSVLLVLTILFSVNVNTSRAFAANNQKLSSREKAIAEAYIKSYENGNTLNLKKYIYPKTKFKINPINAGTDVKIFSSIYVKKYNPITKMNYIVVSCLMTVSNSNELKIFKGTIAINLKTKNKIIYAYSRNTNAEKLDQITISDITRVELNDIEKYIVNKYGEEKALKMMPNDSEKSNIVLFGNKYTYNTTYNYKDCSVTGKFSVKLNSAKNINYDQATEIGYTGFTNENIEFKLVNLTIEGSNLKISKEIVPGYPDFIESIFKGSEVIDVDYISYVQFINNFKINEEFGPNKFVDPNGIYKVTFDVILPVIKGEENYMVFILSGENEPLKKMYFKLK